MEGSELFKGLWVVLALAVPLMLLAIMLSASRCAWRLRRIERLLRDWRKEGEKDE